jgi:iron-sulfur cluster assembly protein
MSTVIESNAVVTMTEAAIKHVKAQLAKRGSGVGLRLGVKKVGCSGYGYVVDFLDEADPEDHVYRVDEDVAIYVDPDSLPFVQGTEVDFVRQGLNAGFEFRNPNVKAMCGCGESFNV